jgi:dTDP-4-amino-4,6-dideoxygalactose transaminase
MEITDLLIIQPHATVFQALEKLDRNGQGILLMLDAAGRLIQTVTDGDIRRLLLAGRTTTSTLAGLPTTSPRTVQRPYRADKVLALMNKFLINQIPVLDEQGRPVELLHRQEVDSQIQILLSTPHLSTLEKEFVDEAFRTNWIAPVGPNIDAFEQEIANYVGAKGAAAVSSGTAAIHLALILAGVKPGDVVFCSSLTFVASANPILYLGANPVFIDSEPESWNMSPTALHTALADAARKNALPRAVVVVNLYGQSADYDPICAACAEYGVAVVEDAAESLGATYKGKASGTFGRLGIFSFNGNKIITTSGGGMLVSDNVELLQRARYLATQARDPAPYYQHSVVGFNYRMSNVLAGIGRGQLRVIDERVAARQAVFRRYVEQLRGVPGLTWMPDAPFGRSTHWLSTGLIDPAVCSLTSAALIKLLADHKIEARRIWKPLHRQPLFAECPYYTHAPGDSVSDRLFETGICLPSGSNLSQEQQDRAIEVLHEAMMSPATPRQGGAQV